MNDLLSGSDLSASPEFATPDRALVFEVIGPVANFVEAARTLGLEWLTEDYEAIPGEDDEESEYLEEEESGTSFLYVTMPSLDGLRRLLALWRRYSKGGAKPDDAKEWWTLFGYLSDIRTWSARDRIDPAIQAFVDRSIELYPDRPIKIELDLWFRENEDLRNEAYTYLVALLEGVDGRLLDFVTIEPIKYQAALVEVPASQARALQAYTGPIADADPVMTVRPQSLFASREREASATPVPDRVPPVMLDGRPAIAALLDGYPIQNHKMLANRVDVEEVDIGGANVPVMRRYHGTAMASLILHGDLAKNEPSLTRALKIVPILAAPQGLHGECTPPDKLPIAMVYRAVLALVTGWKGASPKGEHVVIFNHSVCDQQGAFARRPSAWAKLLDYLSHEYRLLFVVSAGNILDPFRIDTYKNCDDFACADEIERQIVLLRCLEQAKGTRQLLNPAEAVNALTVGAMHFDGEPEIPDGHVNPFANIGVTNLCSAVGLGVNRAIKPDLIEAGGRQLAASELVDSVVSVWGTDLGLVGQLSATADPFGGDTTKLGYSTGTSNAAALVTRSAIRIADTVEALFSDNEQNWLNEPTRAVVLKVLLAHGCAWGQTGALLDQTYPPIERKCWQRRREAISRFIGYGRADIHRIITADGSRITLLADDVIAHNDRHEYSIPIPRAMINNKEVRRVIMTLAWSSPIDPSSMRYRGFSLELVDESGKRKFWSGVKPVLQPSPDAGRRGTLQHIILEDKKLIASTDTGNFVVNVQARAALATFDKQKVPYALAITVEMAQSVRSDLFADVEARVRKKVAERVRERPRSKVRVG
ncbi:hypothetical protein ATCC53582_02717 [Novacetimonas hansenii]|nr:hypothetical protein ATCC53582_02717 [Novacetimonas hansenii]